jgi:hypothetical protein
MLHTIRGGKSPQPPRGCAPAQSADDLNKAIADLVRMSSVLTSLLEDRIRDTRECTLTLDRHDAADIQFVAGQVAAYAEQVRTAWEAI